MLSLALAPHYYCRGHGLDCADRSDQAAGPGRSRGRLHSTAIELTSDVWLSLMLARGGSFLQWVHSRSHAVVCP